MTAFWDFLYESASRSRQPLLLGEGTCTAQNILDLAAIAQTELATCRQGRIGLLFRPAAASLAALRWFEAAQVDVFLMDASLSESAVARLAHQLRLAAVVRTHPESARFSSAAYPAWQIQPFPFQDEASGNSAVTILTSGTSGQPKAAMHTWPSLARPVRIANAPHQTWLLTYQPHLYAGLQVLLHSLLNHASLVVLPAVASPEQIVDQMVTHRVQYVSATPSYWRRLLLFAPRSQLARTPLQQITLGGEVVDQAILDELKSVFPNTRLTHIYATTELGRCFSVTDGKAGFPATLISGPSADGVKLRIVANELQVRSANAMAGYDTISNQTNRWTQDGWFQTGDVVEQVGDRYYFAGRQTDMINTGGNKVYPFQVEQVIRQVGGVRDVRVFGQASSIAGELVACQIVAQPEQAPDALRSAVLAHCRQHLERYQVPRMIEFVEHIELTASGKTRRT